VGQLRMAAGLGISTGLRVVMVILLFIPLMNLAMLLIVSARTTRILRQAGYEVGFFGAPELPS
jgi:hypothetical protein